VLEGDVVGLDEQITTLKEQLAEFGGHKADCPTRFNKGYRGPYSGIHRCDPKLCGWAEIKKELLTS